MTYVQNRPRMVARRARRRRPGLGDATVDLWNSLTTPEPTNVSDLLANIQAKTTLTQTELDCVAQANAKTSDLDARWYNLAQNWNPTGYYKPADVGAIIQTGLVALEQAKVIVLMSPFTTSDTQQMINQAVDDIMKKEADAQRFINAQNAAQAAGTAVNAPDLKDWLVSSLLVASNGWMVSAVMQCNATWLDQAAQYVDAAWAVASKIGGVILAAGETALNVAAGAFDAAAFVSKYAKWGILGFGAWFLYKHVLK